MNLQGIILSEKIVNLKGYLCDSHNIFEMTKL